MLGYISRFLAVAWYLPFQAFWSIVSCISEKDSDDGHDQTNNHDCGLWELHLMPRLQVKMQCNTPEYGPSEEKAISIGYPDLEDTSELAGKLKQCWHESTLGRATELGQEPEVVREKGGLPPAMAKSGKSLQGNSPVDGQQPRNEAAQDSGYDSGSQNEVESEEGREDGSSTTSSTGRCQSEHEWWQRIELPRELSYRPWMDHSMGGTSLIG